LSDREAQLVQRDNDIITPSRHSPEDFRVILSCPIFNAKLKLFLMLMKPFFVFSRENG
jgi:hypothetical protein